MRPPPSSQRGAQAHDEDADDDDNGRTVVRGAPKIVKRSNNSKGSLSPSQRAPNSISPAAVIKATMESARANNRRDGLMAGPPSDLLEDRDDFTDNMAPSQHQQRAPFVGRLDFTGPQLFDYEGPPSHRPPPMSMEGPPSYPPSSNNPFHGNTMQSHRGDNGPPSSRPGAYQPQSYGPPPNQQQGQQQQGQMSVPGVMPASMPAHFMTPQAPYAADPPGTAVTSGHRVAGRPAVSWAAALLAFGLFVGVAAVAVIQSSDSAADTTASFVDPARAPAKAAAPPAAAPVPVPVNANGVPVAAAPNGQGGLIGASPVQPQPPPDPNLGLAAAPVVATPGQPGIAFAPVPVAPAAKPHPHWRPAPPPPAAAPKAPTKPTTIAGSEPDEPKGPKKKPEKADDETKKALEQLQKAQLESAAGGAL